MIFSKKFIIVVCILLIIPVLLLFIITQSEMKKYEPSNSFVIREQAFGSPYLVKVSTIEESYIIEGKFISDKIESVTLPSSCYILFEIDDEIFANQSLSNCQYSKLLGFNGLVKAITQNLDKTIVEVENTDSLIYSGSFKDAHANFESGVYNTVEGIKVELIHKSNILRDGKRNYTFKFHSGQFSYGMEQSFIIKTGNALENVIAVENEAIYTNSFGKPSLRIVDENGNVLGEREVTVGISNGLITAVNGVEVGEYYDLEYGKYLNEK